MNKTYDEILEDMKNAYFNECGEKAEDNSQLEKRFEAVASELFAVSCYGDYVFKQAFVQTATGENLDNLGAVRNCARKTASTAQGTLTFTVDEPATEKITISKGTVCSAESSAYLQFATTKSATIPVGKTSVTVSAEALDTGYEYNVAVGEITVMVNAPVGINSVVNEVEFSGGYDDESDSAYRSRIINHYAITANGFNPQSVANAVLLLDFVTDCFIPVAETSGDIVAIVATKNNKLTSAQSEQVRKAIGISEVTGAGVDVLVATPQNFSVVVEANVRAGFDKSEVENQIKSIVNEVASACRIGTALQLNTIKKKLSALSEISSYDIYSNDAYGDAVPCNSTSYLYLSNLVVNCFDE